MKKQKQKANTPAYQEDTEKVSKLKKGEKLLFCMISLFCSFCCFFFLCTLIDRAAECLAGIHFLEAVKVFVHPVETEEEKSDCQCQHHFSDRSICISSKNNDYLWNVVKMADKQTGGKVV